MPTLADFLMTGKLGRIAAGLSKDEVRQILGDPADVSVQKNPEIWKYGALQLGFLSERDATPASLSYIGLYFRRAEEAIPEALAMTGWMPTQKTTLQEMRHYLTASNGVTGESVVRESDGDLVIENSGVRLCFDEGKLHSINFAAPGKTQRRQISILIPENILEVIRQEAAERKVSVSALCAQWIKDHAMNLCRTGT
jgi:hypothetical protein